MGKILVIHGSNFSQNRIDKVNISKQVEIEKTVDSQTFTSTVYVNNNSSLKNND